MSAPTFEGGCLCRAVRYRASGQPVARSLCHCRTCRLAAGSPSVAWVVWRSSGFSFTTGTPASYESSPGIVRTFCNRCGTPLTYQRRAEPDTIDTTTVTLDAADEFAPTKEIWTEHKLSWECVNNSLPQYPRSSRPS
jgi:hypothetical protein